MIRTNGQSNAFVTWSELARLPEYIGGNCQWQFEDSPRVLAGPLKEILPYEDKEGAQIVLWWYAYYVRVTLDTGFWKVGNPTEFSFQADNPHLHSAWNTISVEGVSLFTPGHPEALRIPEHVLGYSRELQNLLRECEELPWSEGAALNVIKLIPAINNSKYREKLDAKSVRELVTSFEHWVLVEPFLIRYREMVRIYDRVVAGELDPTLPDFFIKLREARRRSRFHDPAVADETFRAHITGARQPTTP